jgi:hypothetical protein
MTVYFAYLCLLIAGLFNLKGGPIDKEPLVRLYAEESPGILQITFWPDMTANSDAANNIPKVNVDGTGFLVGREGYFITAAHVLQRYDVASHRLRPSSINAMETVLACGSM